MARVWKEGIAPKYLHDNFGAYHGIWMPQMDRCWFSDDGYQVTSRILITDWGRLNMLQLHTMGMKKSCFRLMVVGIFLGQ